MQGRTGTGRTDAHAARDAVLATGRPSRDQRCRHDGTAAGERGYGPGLDVAIDPAAFGDADAFAAAVGTTLGTLESLPSADGAEGVLYPGERSASVAVRRAEEGVPVAGKVWRELARSAERFGVTPPVTAAT
ncbi:Ldh family oxidoreductase [Streptomyces sp. Tue6028]|uniref:Ldh family oxidoreductase n=1 Tax=Streptomyces sp. Tue6028 TaxID=2036037 RepID=UPI00211B7628|nr:Ldh family oxidoreductase [Streptomyces sp. Tue6028]